MGYEEGRQYLTDGNLCQAEAAFAKGMVAGDIRCVYGMLKICLAVNNEQGADRFLGQLTERFPELTALAEAGDDHAVFILGSCYENGWCVPEDADEAIRCYEQIADRYALAQYNIGCVLIAPGREDYRAAIPWFERAMNSGDREARFNLGYCYWKLSDEQSIRTAKALFVQAAEDGDELAQMTLDKYFQEE